MNQGKGHNVFNDIPGFDASKGERILKALEKLWRKIQLLEHSRVTERKSSCQETNSKYEDLTITDVQYRLLVLQLKYVRSILREKNKNQVTLHSKGSDVDQRLHEFDRHDPKRNEHDEGYKNKVDTGIRKNFTEHVNPYMDPDFLRNIPRTDVQVTNNDELHKLEKFPEHLASSSSKPHYHLKLDDVPFILGASSTASHSVVANVQNIIAMMKSHNKALCGPKPHASRSTVNVQPAGGDIRDTTKMLNDLSEELYELALKQKKLAKSLDAAQGKNQISNLSKNLQGVDKVNRICNVKHTSEPSMRRLRSNSESEIKLQAEVKNFSKRKESDFVKYNVQHKQNVLNVRSQPSNLSIMDRRKLLRSLQNFKSHLSEEDISWD